MPASITAAATILLVTFMVCITASRAWRAWLDVRRMEIDFRGSARIDDILDIHTTTQDVSGARIFMAQTISREGQVLVEAKVEAAIVSEGGRPRRFTKEWVAAFMPGREG